MSPQMGEVTTVDVNALIAAHTAVLDAHTYNHLQKARTGEYYIGGTTYRSVAAVALVANRLYAHELIIARTMTFDRIAFDVNAQAGEKVRVGIYNDGDNLYPGTLVLDAGEVTLTAAQVEPIPIDLQLTRGFYWLAVISNGTPSLIGCQSRASPLGMLPIDFNLRYVGWIKASTYNGLADPFPAGGSLHNSNNHMPFVSLRVASLD